ncbi:adenylate/guanylate cyclase domain-containing protein [Thalassococcus sp. S3]|uniref:adenylate/guanylate cyclase domain-containing protein n=1 Tax=Thalassococcus sp. S3 TaxID=2017482 RepID=UPI0010247943|nr:adenylate/guanylate cyclase domain-containing protein [Thalassococcus sp. S3]QBF30126.1 hypothetical protein CFI11_02685 [Thalassococcus sp. S3]
MTIRSDWRSGTAISWLLEEGRLLGDITSVLDGLGAALLSAGAPVARLRLALRTVHPLVSALSVVWERGKGITGYAEAPHGLESRPAYIGSPMEMIAVTQLPFRKRLNGVLAASDHVVLHELKSAGFTDYLGLPLRYSDGGSGIMIATTDLPDGFSDRDLVKLGKVASALAPIIEIFRLQHLTHAIADAYLGPRTGQRVLSGQITRGQIDKMEAAIFVSDLRDWTKISADLTPDAMVSLVNRYFDIVAEAVETEGGEILKLLGDGVLAIFPSSSPDAAEAACSRALRAADAALRKARESHEPLETTFGIAIHYGDVLYGNVGSAKRIDFTVMGQAVNIAARLEHLCSKFGEPLVFTERVARTLSQPARYIATEHLKGVSAPQAVFAI